MDGRSIALPLALLLSAVLIAGIVRNEKQKGIFDDPRLLTRGLETPTVWIFVDDTDVNSRWWADFGSRSSRVYNMPFLNLCYETIVRACGKKYHIEVIGGLADAERRLGSLPAPMRNKRLPLRDEEMTYLKVAFLEKYGGLWINPATIVLQPFPELPKEKIVLFGSDPLETYAGPQGTTLPNQHAMWSPKPHHSFFSKWKSILESRIERQAGGKEIRNDSRWDLIFNGAGRKDIVTMANIELTRKSNGRKIELEDLLAAGTEGVLPFEVSKSVIYVPFPWPEVLERRMFGWFLRMSEEQILESDLAVSHLFHSAGL